MTENSGEAPRETPSQHKPTKEQRDIASIFLSENPLEELARVSEESKGTRPSLAEQARLRRAIGKDAKGVGKITKDGRRSLDLLTWHYLPHVDRLVREYQGLGLDTPTLLESAYDLVQDLIITWEPPEHFTKQTEELSHFIASHERAPIRRMITDMYGLKVNQFPLVELYFDVRKAFLEKQGREPGTEDLEALTETVLTRVTLPTGQEPAERTRRRRAVNRIKEALGRIHHHQYLDAISTSEVDKRPIADPEQVGNQALLKKATTASVATLSSRQRQVIRMRFGLETGEEMTGQEVADKLGVHPSRVYFLEKEGLSKLRHPKRSSRLRPFFED